jgi:hypothetical protein
MLLFSNAMSEMKIEQSGCNAWRLFITGGLHAM